MAAPLPEGAAVKQVMETLIKRLRGAYRPSQDLYCVGHTMNLRAGDMGRFSQTSGAQNPSSTDYLVTSLLRRTHSERLTSHTHDVWCVGAVGSRENRETRQTSTQVVLSRTRGPLRGRLVGSDAAFPSPGVPVYESAKFPSREKTQMA